MSYRLIFSVCLVLSLNYLLKGADKNTFWGNWFSIDEFNKVVFFSIKPWGEVVLEKDATEDFTSQKGSWSEYSDGIMVQFSNRKNQYLYPSLKAIDILICKDQFGNDLRYWVLMEQPISLSSKQEIDYLSLYREKIQSLTLKGSPKTQEGSSLEDNQDAFLPEKTYPKDPIVSHKKSEQGLLKKLNDSSNFKGIWQSVDETEKKFGVHLKNNGSFTFLGEPDDIRGEWMVVNQRALLIYPSGWRQSIDRSSSDLKKYYLSSFRPNESLSDSPTIIFEVRLLDGSEDYTVASSENTKNLDGSQGNLVVQKADSEKQTDEKGAMGINTSSDKSSRVLPEFIGSWQSLEENNPAFGVNLFENGRFSLFKNPTKIEGEWMVFNHRALLIYPSGWRQLIDWSVENPKEYYLSTLRPNQRVNDPTVKRFAIQKRLSSVQ